MVEIIDHHIMIEHKVFGVNPLAEQVDDILLLSGREQPPARLVARIGTVATKILFHRITQGCIVLALYLGEKMIESPSHAQQFGLGEEGALIQTSHMRQNDLCRQFVENHLVANLPAQALLEERTVAVETENVAFRQISKIYLHDCVVF